ncbi:MAG: S4 domain-containing protein [Sphingomonadaceae bacterium]|uniref:S4 domain-containing protein n=1 Tax=Thermaurantiacus sp. TaxID=2820283 RepID=UPI00298EE88A|nr:S4 domain-containing protein [Thermaurantiacus sp.]MCS6987829.1 S4 domain-containing protein [Sphingomonadaceae bacterium]MDW8414951.1 S4 domain-containing protein [Thermaurantiacus sp.]
MVHGPAIRLDKWLWFARLARTRGEAQHLCESRRLRLDGRVVERSCARVRPGSVIAFARGDRIVAVRVEALAERRGPSEDARRLYTPLLGEEQARLEPA